jgi:tetratricopeptide (TPR) repeat protein
MKSAIITSKSPKLCLNMIVKNESKIITRLFDSVYNIIDSYCICDTGSSDNTVELIESYFRSKNIPGKVVQEPFRDFGYNRTYALQQCENMESADYILLLDADMVLKISDNFDLTQFKNKLSEFDQHHIFQGSEHFYYKNARIVKNRIGIKYWGVTHEYVQTPDGTTTNTFDNNDIFIMDVGDGGSKTDKFQRDIQLLSNALEQTPDNDRYTFYLANSYKDCGQYQNAIDTYKKRVKLGGWIEEIWYSYFAMGRCYKWLGDMDHAIISWLNAFSVFPERIENLYEIIHYYRETGKNELAYIFFKIADDKKRQSKKFDYLFLEKDVYNYKLDYELSIVGYYHNVDNYDLARCCMNLMAYHNIEHWIFNNVLSNYKFYAPKIDRIQDERLCEFEKIGKNLITSTDFKPTKNLIRPVDSHSSWSMTDKEINPSPEEADLNLQRFKSSTPSLCFHNNELIINVRYVNYHINDSGGYENKEHITTHNVFTRYNTLGNTYIKIQDDEIIKYDKMYDDRYVGLEDMRLFSYKGKLLYNANRGIGQTNMVIEHGEIDLDTGSTKSVLLKYEKQKEIEKNWVLFEDCSGNLKCIYSWHPLVIGDINNETGDFIVSNVLPTANIFNHFRGSTNGVNIDGEIWFLCHVVSHENRRFYYHVMVALDKNTFKIKRYTPFFTFDKMPVEYTLGMVYKNGSLTIGYSLLDRETKYTVVPKKWFEQMFERIGFARN